MKPVDSVKLRECINYFGRKDGHGVAALEIVEASLNFHCRLRAQDRRYAYVICNRAACSALLHQHVCHVQTPLNVEAMQAAARRLLGYHNFTSFRAISCDAPHAMRTLEECNVVRDGDFIIVSFRARSFLRNQVRIIMGTLIQIGMGMHGPLWIDELFAARDRRKAGKTAPAYGLYLMGVEYRENMFTIEPRMLLFPS
eukprot:gnl/TRDRNA2_/TRDRNA2_77308_c3_seq1.p1 gnl/TRDRNA2_/TRDRNA2_77308_c3~~gnl/TRDRNA2_/TRDRNA2_77308_c3_seq1.p1  ORF type:complete len:232 (+),score=19.91 gnl/TRDRNA2_/TRDRNA2_77308_c3_seq1:103-696(+)